MDFLKALRPKISPMPPARLLMTAVRTASARSLLPDAPPELINPARPCPPLLLSYPLPGCF